MLFVGVDFQLGLEIVEFLGGTDIAVVRMLAWRLPDRIRHQLQLLQLRLKLALVDRVLHLLLQVVRYRSPGCLRRVN